MPTVHSCFLALGLKCLCDCDLILWGDEVIDTPLLTVPHPRARQRQFVLEPLNEIAPEMMFPDGTTVAQAWALLQKDLA